MCSRGCGGLFFASAFAHHHHYQDVNAPARGCQRSGSGGTKDSAWIFANKNGVPWNRENAPGKGAEMHLILFAKCPFPSVDILPSFTFLLRSWIILLVIQLTGKSGAEFRVKLGSKEGRRRILLRFLVPENPPQMCLANK